MIRTISAISPVTIGTKQWVFDSLVGLRRPDPRRRAGARGARTYTAAYRLDSGAVGTGTGLKATYFDNVDLTSPVTSQVEPIVMILEGGQRGPGAGRRRPAPTRCAGRAASPRSSRRCTTFFLQGDDGVRLWVNNVLVVDQWGPHTNTEYKSAGDPDDRGRPGADQVEMRQGSGRLGQARLMWRSTACRSRSCPTPSCTRLPERDRHLTGGGDHVGRLPDLGLGSRPGVGRSGVGCTAFGRCWSTVTCVLATRCARGRHERTPGGRCGHRRAR